MKVRKNSKRFGRLWVLTLACIMAAIPILAIPKPAAAADTADWLPFKVGSNVVEIGCTWNNGCLWDLDDDGHKDDPYHPYFAIDFIIGGGTTIENGGKPIPVYASGPGDIVDSCISNCDNRGNFVEIAHTGGDGRHSRYLHLNKVVKASGDVARGELIGYSGNTSGNGVHHLHYDETINDQKVDPGPMLAMHNNSIVSYPQAINSSYDTWNKVPQWSNKWVWSQGFGVGAENPEDVVRNYARNGGFNNGTTRWSASNANFVVRTDSDAYEGTGYARANTAVSGGRIRNDYALNIKSTDAFCMEAMVKADEGTTASGTLMLWLLGDSPNESSKISFTATDTWQPIQVCTYATGDHTSLSAQIFPTAGGNTVSVDAVDVHKSLARNGGFNNGTARWTAANANFAVRADSDAYEDSGYGRTNTINNGSIRNDLTLEIKSTDAFCMEVMVKADAGTTASGAIMLWLIGDSTNESSTTHFTATETWQPVKACTYATGNHTSLSARIYPTNGGNTVSVDAVDVHRSLARNGGFNDGTTRWTGQDANFVVRTDSDAYEGDGYARTNTVAGGNIRNDYTMDIKSTYAYCLEAMVRADNGTTAEGTLVLWLAGGENNESRQMQFTATDTWQPIKVCTYATDDHDYLSARIYPATGGTTVSVDAVDVH